MRTRVFTVTPETWEEHKQAGVAGINDPVAAGNSAQLLATRQKVLTELAGIRPGDKLFFYLQREKMILGGFEATSPPYFDPSPVIKGAQHVDRRYPFRVCFQQTTEYPKPLHINQIWAGRDAGKFWTMQQARGDSVGRHACWALANKEGVLLERMLNELNVVVRSVAGRRPIPQKAALPIDFRLAGVQMPRLHYESTLSHLFLEGLAENRWRDIFGEYDDFLPFVTTSEGKEMDVLILKYDTKLDILWYQILELKADRFRHENLLQLLAYETWLTSSQAEGNPRSVHMTALARRFDQDVIENVAARKSLLQKEVQLIEYDFNPDTRSLQLRRLD